MSSCDTSDDLVAKLETALYVAAGRSSDTETLCAPGWVQITTRDAKTHFRNGVLRSVLEPGALESRVDEVVEHYRRLGLPFRWMVTPSTRPRDTGEALVRRGLRRDQTLHAMVADPSDFPAHHDARVEVTRIGMEDVETWLSCMARGWDMAPAGVDRFRRELRRRLAEPEPTSVYFLAQCDGKPCGNSSLSRVEDYAHFNGAEVLHDFRGRGAYRAMVLERMRFLRDLGVRLVTNHCVSTTSAPICARLGFSRVCDFDVYVLEG